MKTNYFGSLEEKSDRVTFIQEELHTLNQIVQEDNQSDIPSKTHEKKTINEIDIKTESKINTTKERQEKEDKSKITPKKIELENYKKENDIDSKTEKVKVQEQKEDQMVRRFSLKIRDIKFHNLQKEILNVFLQFIIGKDLIKKVSITALGRQTTYIQTSEGARFKTELLKAVEHGEIRNINVSYDSEYRGTYEMLAEENLTVQVWDYSKWRLNKYLGKYSISLLELANSHINRSVPIRMIGQNKKIFARIHFVGYFQEIWDWKISFTEWKGTNIVNKYSQPTESKITLCLKTKEIREPKVESKLIKESSNPFWGEIKDSMNFRGTYDELENNLLSIELRTKSKKMTKVTSLRGISDSGYAKVNFKLYDQSSRPKGHLPFSSQLNSNQVNENDPFEQFRKKKKKKKEEGGEGEGDVEGEEEEEEEEGEEKEEKEEEEEKLFQQQYHQMIFGQVEGRVILNRTPKFKQKGELIRFKENQRYLVITINKVEDINAPDDRNIINSFVSVNWGGHEKMTQIFYDSNRPEFNEIIIYRLPGKIPLNRPEKLDFLKDELNVRSEIVFDLWIKNEDDSNENVGYASFKLSELMKAKKEEHFFNEFYTRKKMLRICRTYELYESFISAIIDSPNTKLLAQIYFFPDIPESLDLKTLKYDMDDKFPSIIRDEMLNGIDGKFYDDWKETIKANFSKISLDKMQINILENRIFVKDQYGKSHFLSKYLGKYSVEENLPNDMSLCSKAQKEELIKDLRMKTYGELAHLVRCLPFFEENRKNNEIWLSSDFVLTLKKGNIQDHAVLLANFFMGTTFEKNEDIENKTPNIIIPNKDRVFVCVGTVGKNKPEFHCWVMTLDPELETVTFWETTKNENYELKGRITSNKEELKKLKFLLSGKDFDVEKGNSEFFGYLKKIKENMSPTILRKSSKTEMNSHLSKKIKTKIIEEEEEEYDGNDDIDLAKEYDFRENIFEIIDDPVADIATMPAFFQAGSKKKQAAYISGEPTNDNERGGSKNPGVESKFLKHRKEELKSQEELKKDEQKLLRKRDFVDGKTGEIVEIGTLPYNTIDLIFNQKNVYANLQNSNPNYIYYNIHNPNEWKPFITLKDSPFTDDLSAFFECKGLVKGLDLDECSKKMSGILNEVMLEVGKVRNGGNLGTKWRNKIDKTNRHLEKLLKIFEYKNTRRYNSNEEYLKEMDEWTIKMKELIPVYFKFRGLPMFFNYTQQEKIRSLIIENCQQFYMQNYKETYFGLAGRIFPYPNGFNSVRLIMAVYFQTVENTSINDFESEDADKNIDDLMKDGNEYQALTDKDKNQKENKKVMEDDEELEEN